MTSEGKGTKAVGRRAARSISNTPAVNRRTAHELVDTIFQQWQMERPDINATPVHIYGLIGQIHLQATAFINEVLEPLGLVRGTFDVLTALRRAGARGDLRPDRAGNARHLWGRAGHRGRAQLVRKGQGVRLGRSAATARNAGQPRAVRRS